MALHPSRSVPATGPPRSTDMKALLRPIATLLFGASIALLAVIALPMVPSDGQAPSVEVVTLPAVADDPAGALDAAAVVDLDPLAQPDDGSAPPAPPPPEEEAPVEWIEHTIAPGEALGRILPRWGIPPQEVWEAARPHVDLNKVQAGKVLRLHRGPDGATVDRLEYALTLDRTLVVAPDAQGVWRATVDVVEYERREGVRSFTVNRSLWEAAVQAGLRPADIVALADVFRYDIDFNTEVRQGARAELVVEELYVDGELRRLGAPLAVRFHNNGKQYLAIRFEGADGESRYYDATGHSRKRPFLRSPLKFSRVTSGFSRNRFHPVLKQGRPHYGVDFGAPEGTPIYAVGDGVVSWAGPNGGHGRFVKLDHAGPYDSSYSHMSRVSVKKGQKVRQGQLLGYVGSTGLSTGPHLHYQFWVDGRYVNPLTVELPKGGEPVADTQAAAFAAHRDAMLSRLDGTEVQPAQNSTAVADIAE